MVVSSYLILTERSHPRQLHIREQDTPKLDYDEAFNILRSKGQLASFKIEANRKYGLLAALALGKIQPVHYLTHCEEVKLRETRVSVVDPKHFPKARRASVDGQEARDEKLLVDAAMRRQRTKEAGGGRRVSLRAGKISKLLRIFCWARSPLYRNQNFEHFPNSTRFAH